MGEGNSLINLGELAKPATVLIEKISDAVGGYFKPFQMKRLAQADAEVALIRAHSQFEITEVHERAMHRFVYEEGKRQENIEAITEKALPQLEDKSQPQKMENDWISNFFDKCRIVSDGEMQQLWAKVLAGEANVPGTYSKRTVNFLGSLEKQDALFFSKLCGFAWMIGDPVPLIFDVQQSIYLGEGINFDILTHLDNIGLITFQSITGFQRQGFPKQSIVHYYERPILLEFRQEQSNNLETGKVLFTQTGQQLVRICKGKPVPGFEDYVLTHWLKKGCSAASPYPRTPGAR